MPSWMPKPNWVVTYSLDLIYQIVLWYCWTNSPIYLTDTPHHLTKSKSNYLIKHNFVSNCHSIKSACAPVVRENMSTAMTAHQLTPLAPLNVAMDWLVHNVKLLCDPARSGCRLPGPTWCWTPIWHKALLAKLWSCIWFGLGSSGSGQQLYWHCGCHLVLGGCSCFLPGLLICRSNCHHVGRISACHVNTIATTPHLHWTHQQALDSMLQSLCGLAPL